MIPICAATLRHTQNFFLVHIKSVPQAAIATPQELLAKIDDAEVFTLTGPVDDEAFNDGFAFAISVLTYTSINNKQNPVDVIVHILNIFDALGINVISYKTDLTEDNTITNNIRFVTNMYSQRFFTSALLYSRQTEQYTEQKLGKSCECKSIMPLLPGPWNNGNCPMYSEHDIPTKYEDDPPTCTIVPDVKYGLKRVTATIRDGLIAVEGEPLTEDVPFGNTMWDLRTLTRSRLISYLETIGYSIDTSQLPPRWIQDGNVSSAT